MSVAFAVVALLNAAWPLIGGVNPPGVSPDIHLVTVSARNTDGRSGFRASAVESLRDLPGVRSLYYARPTVFFASHEDRQTEAVTALVNDRYFTALGVRLQGPGFSRFGPWQRNLPRECVVSPKLQQELTGSRETTLLGRDIQLNDETCRVVGIADPLFEGLRPPMRIGLWLSWPSIIGLGVPDMAPDEYLEAEERIQQLGIVRDPQMPLSTLEAAITTRLRLSMPELGEVRLLAGDGMEPAPRHRLLKEIRLVVLAVGVLLAVILVFAVSYALWFGESMRGSQGVRVALGATAQRLVRHSVRISVMQCAASVLVGSMLALVTWRLLLAKTSLGEEFFPLGRALPTSAILLGALVVMVLSLCTWLAEIRAWLWQDGRTLSRALRKFTATAWIETATAGFIVAATLVASLLATWILTDFMALRSVSRGYVAGDIRLLEFSAPEFKGHLQFPTRTRRGHSVDAVGKVLSEWTGSDRVAMSDAAPYRGYNSGQQNVLAEGAKDRAPGIRIAHHRVSGNFFSVYGIPVLEGTSFSSAKAHEVVLSESAARRLLGEAPWVGRRVVIDSDGPFAQPRPVVGVIRDVAFQGRNSTIREAHYTPVQDMNWVQVIAVAGPARVDLDDAGTVLGRIGITDPLKPPVLLGDLDAEDDRAGLIRASALMGACVLAILLGAIGLSEMLLVIANRRLPEFALRSALGATVRRLAWSLFRAQLPALAAGVLLGMAFFAVAANHLVSRGFRVTPPESGSVVQALAALVVLLVLMTIPSLLKLRRIPTAVLLKQD